MKPEVARHLINSRLLVLQSKRLMLGSIQRRPDETSQELDGRVRRLRAEIDTAQHLYRAAMLEYGSPAHNEDFWLIAYGRLIQMGAALATKLRNAVADLPPGDRYEVSADVEAIEEILKHWNAALRAAMAGAVA